MRILLAMGICLVTGTLALAAEGTMKVTNETLAVTVDAAGGTFSAKAGDVEFIKGGKLSASGGQGKEIAVEDRLGKGKGIEVSYPTGNADRVMVYEGWPFVVIQNRQANSGKEKAVVEKVAVASFGIEAAKYPAMLGTGGLRQADKAFGSYSYLAAANGQSRAGVVVGWVTHHRANGVVMAEPQGDAVTLTARAEYGKLLLEPGQIAEGEILAIGYFADARLGLEKYADAIAAVENIHLPKVPCGYCTWYHKPYGGASDEKHLAETAEYCGKNLKRFGFDFIQIDDGWQDGIKGNGPKKNFTQVAAKGSYSSGMKAMAEKINGEGLTAGIWFMPFAGTFKDAHFASHADWFVKGPDGKVFETKWGENCLDVTNPTVKEYVKELARRASKEWGYKLFKLDGAWTGTGTKIMYVNEWYRDDSMGETTFSDPRKTNMEAYREGWQAVREGAGKDVFLLGCCISQNLRSMGGAFGLLDAMRIGPDNGTSWKGIMAGPKFGSRSYFLHGRVWWNDADVLYVGKSFTLEQARAWASWVTIAGTFNLVSEWMPVLPAERLELLRRTMPNHQLKARPVDLFEEANPRVWQLTDARGERRDVIGLFNWDEKSAAEFKLPLSRLDLPEGGKGQYVGFDYWANEFVAPFEGTIEAKVPAMGCRVLAIRPALDRPQVISTSRHITQGVVDVVEEKWDASGNALRGVSRVVGEDAYELRVVAPGWTAASAEVSAEDKAAGVSVGFKQEGSGVRVKIESKANREVKWTVTFKKA